MNVTHCSETIFNPNVEELTVFFHIIIFHIYMDNFIAFLKYFTEGRVKKCPFCTQQWLKTTFEWPKVVSEVSFPRFGRIRTNRYISETALQITETKMETVFYRPKYPQNIGKLTSETTFGHLKVVFGHCYIQKS